MRSHLYLPDAAKPRHKQLKRLILAVRDMQLGSSALKFAATLKEDDPVRTHLISIAVIYYARPFVSTRGFARISGKWERFDDSSMTKLHALVYAWRNVAVAHSEDELNEVEFIPKGSKFQVSTTEGKVGEITLAAHGEFYRGPKFPSSLVGKFIDLCVFQEGRIKSEASRQKEELFHEFIEPTKSG